MSASSPTFEERALLGQERVDGVAMVLGEACPRLGGPLGCRRF